ncbi:MAG: inositol-3-phosphate synthase [Saprospiraceae bacterium]|nr:inositol-3-phosphate synthase [Saprospiraceae bacterium]MBK7220932.1 inositol-3-phosphate synthase [Saprospiraceae bacterium]MBK7789745.1 inositol-3-phosphate synthase [Saprospiraceae bacterium]MBK8850974.1 inositol-3-phosphate synthase [Saprospiraceae bacterium]MBK9688251.1 inositol-3-phosphate synthase [Saprospiraceae bacterium]
MSKSANKINVEKPKGKLGILLPGLGAVATTTIAGVIAVNKGLSEPVGSLTQIGRMRVGKRTQKNNPLIKDVVPIQPLKDVVFGGWDIYEDNVYESAINAAVLDKRLLDQIKGPLTKIKPMRAVFDPVYVKRLDGKYVKKGKTKMDLAKAIMKDIENFKKENKCDRLVMVWCGSTEIYIQESEVHKSLAALEKGMKENHKDIPPSMLYAYAAIKMGVPYANGAPNLSCDIPALVELADKTMTPIAGKDFKTGQTLMKTVIAPGLKARALGVDGWFSTNILGNRDGAVLDDPDNFKTKEVSKLSVLEEIFEPESQPELYKDMYHKVRINYYPPRGDNKESWDNIDIRGWLNYPMQIKVNFLCRDSILAAPIVLDLALFLDLAKRSGMYGIQEWLSFYLKSPQAPKGLHPIHDIFKQLNKLENTLRHIAGEELITNLGLDYGK